MSKMGGGLTSSGRPCLESGAGRRRSCTTPNMAYQMATMPKHIHTRVEFTAASARSPSALCWFTGVLRMVHQIQSASAIASDDFLHSGAMILHADLLGMAVVQDMLADGWLASAVFRLRLQRVWKRARAPSMRKAQVCGLHQQPGRLPQWLTDWDAAQDPRGVGRKPLCPYRTLWSGGGEHRCPVSCGFAGGREELAAHTQAQGRLGDASRHF